MKASAGAILLQLQEQVGYPFTILSPDMYRYGGGGIASWGTLCGTVNGPAAIINLVAPAADIGKLTGELLGWYSETALPTDKHSAWAKFPQTVQSVAGNPLCHASVSNWCATSGLKENSDERKDRCAKLSGDCAAKTIELLNAYFDGKFAETYQISAETERCRTCHVTRRSDTLTKMECAPCHPNAHKK